MPGIHTTWISRTALLWHTLLSFWRIVAAIQQSSELQYHLISKNLPQGLGRHNGKFKITKLENPIAFMNYLKYQNQAYDIPNNAFQRNTRAERNQNFLDIDLSALRSFKGEPAIMGIFDVSVLSKNPDTNLPISHTTYPEITEKNENYVISDQKESPYDRLPYIQDEKINNSQLPEPNTEANEIPIFTFHLPIKTVTAYHSVINKKWDKNLEYHTPTNLRLWPQHRIPEYSEYEQKRLPKLSFPQSPTVVRQNSYAQMKFNTPFTKRSDLTMDSNWWGNTKDYFFSLDNVGEGGMKSSPKYFNRDKLFFPRKGDFYFMKDGLVNVKLHPADEAIEV